MRFSYSHYLFPLPGWRWGGTRRKILPRAGRRGGSVPGRGLGEPGAADELQKCSWLAPASLGLGSDFPQGGFQGKPRRAKTNAAGWAAEPWVGGLGPVLVSAAFLKKFGFVDFSWLIPGCGSSTPTSGSPGTTRGETLEPEASTFVEKKKRGKAKFWQPLPSPLSSFPTAEEQVHQEDPQGRGGLQRAGDRKSVV